jgi:hypothetical protein
MNIPKYRLDQQTYPTAVIRLKHSAGEYKKAEEAAVLALPVTLFQSGDKPYGII